MKEKSIKAYQKSLRTFFTNAVYYFSFKMDKEAVLKLLSIMEICFCPPLASTFYIILSKMRHTCSFNELFKFLTLMNSYGLPGDEVIFSLFFDKVSNERELKLLMSFVKLKDNCCSSKLYDSAIQAHLRIGLLVEAKSLFDESSKKDFSISIKTSVLLVDAFVKNKNLQTAKLVLFAIKGVSHATSGPLSVLLKLYYETKDHTVYLKLIRTFKEQRAEIRKRGFLHWATNDINDNNHEMWRRELKRAMEPITQREHNKIIKNFAQNIGKSLTI
ncbi:uncharacterized protein LOC135146204 [Zophobas morio]|uniref:uncharacterized protein LOC135146204 n=1 Tax=Zophobas morio TaxID=2755281 RepID=UPI00308273B9